MVDPNPSALPTARAFPDDVPILIDAEEGVTLRAAREAIFRQWWSSAAIRRRSAGPCSDSRRWLSAPRRRGLSGVAAGWTNGQRLGWTIEAQRGAERGFCGSIVLHLEGDGVAEVGFGLHPLARGGSIMTAALHLVCDYGFKVAALRAIRWRAAVVTGHRGGLRRRSASSSTERSGVCSRIGTS